MPSQTVTFLVLALRAELTSQCKKLSRYLLQHGPTKSADIFVEEGGAVHAMVVFNHLVRELVPAPRKQEYLDPAQLHGVCCSKPLTRVAQEADREHPCIFVVRSELFDHIITWATQQRFGEVQVVPLGDTP